MSTPLDKKLDDLIAKLTQRNEEIQEKKQAGPWGWVVSAILALISLVGIGVAIYYTNRRAKELAQAKTQIEQDKVDQDQRAQDAKKVPLLQRRGILLEALKEREKRIQERELSLREAERVHAERKKKLEGLKAWGAINEA